MLKVYEFISKKLEEEDFKIVESNWFWNKEAYFYFKILNEKLQPYKKHYGPPLKFEKDVKIFKNKYRDSELGIEFDKIFVILPRKYIKLKDLTKDLIKYDFIKKQVKSITIFRNS